MTDHPHTPPNNPRGNPHRTTAYPRHSAGLAKRRARVRGCGVPATVWFAPHPETPATAETRNDTHRREPHPWTLAEIIRQFTAPGQTYTIARIAEQADDIETPVTRHRREPAPENYFDGDCEIGDNSGSDALVALIPGESDGPGRPWPLGAPRDALTARLAQHIEFAHRALRDGGILAIQIPRPTPGPGFRDDTGTTITTVRDKGFAYLQHIALVDSLIAEEGITPALPQADLDAFWAARAQGLRVHARSHSDLLVFGKTGKADPRD